MIVHRCWERFFYTFYKMNENKVKPVKPQSRGNSSVNIKQLWAMSVINWQWFIFSVIACVFLAGVYLWFTPTKFNVVGKMEIKDKSNKNSGLSAGMAMLSNLPMGLGSALGGSLGGSLGIDAEKEIFKSNSLVRPLVNADFISSKSYSLPFPFFSPFKYSHSNSNYPL